jgi:hypothetical protein
MRREPETIFETPRRAWLLLAEAPGVTYAEVDIVGETERRYRIWARVRTRLGGRALKPGDRALVDKALVRWTTPPRASRTITR